MERAGSEYTLTLRRWDHKVVRQVRASLAAGSWSWSWEKDWVWGQGSLLATIGATEGMQQVVVDHPGSVGLLANRCGQRLAELATNPWGLDLFSTTQNGERHRYTGHLRDTNALDRAWDEFDYMHALYYFPYTGRFVSVDLGRNNDPKVPQSWNRYSYALNNPLRYVDPYGADAVDFVSGLANAFGSDMLLGAGRQEPINRDFAAGQAVGDALAVVVGTAEAALGLGGSAFGLGLSATGAGALVGAPAAAVSAATVVQGVGGATTGASNLVKFAKGAKGGTEDSATPSRGNLKRVSEAELKKMGINAHALKEEFVGEQGKLYDIYRDREGNLLLVRQGRTKQPPIETGEKWIRDVSKE